MKPVQFRLTSTNAQKIEGADIVIIHFYITNVERRRKITEGLPERSKKDNIESLPASPDTP
ncbi:hypothetical protein T12_8455 [Trichinella patagoniensis]|uniref:Uncharacterized protein n=1 Tax=Trichinella patagoniensis TaxID=990121 RepID=A0A0V0YYJ4_9BILA|nr:hypothetical protein T12_11017 [Trichinella patagoniensis]KRY06263.1 hypothetical protein T12_8455 [Trichinella patagoniensis]